MHAIKSYKIYIVYIMVQYVSKPRLVPGNRLAAILLELSLAA